MKAKTSKLDYIEIWNFILQKAFEKASHKVGEKKFIERF